jgi:hypothetical protein
MGNAGGLAPYSSLWRRGRLSQSANAALHPVIGRAASELKPTMNVNRLTSTLDFQAQALTLRAERQRVIASNIAPKGSA